MHTIRLVVLMGMTAMACRAWSQTPHLYWTDTGTDKIQRAKIDGANVEDLVTFPGSTQEPAAFTLDPKAGKMYWIDAGSNKIQRANLDGTAIEDLLPGGVDEPADLALDAVRQRMYWTDGAAIFRSHLDGSSVEEVMRFFPDRPSQIVIDATGGKLYWVSTEEGAGFVSVAIRRANLDGGAIENLVESDLVFPTDLMIDAAAEWLYVADVGTAGRGRILRIELNSFFVETLIPENAMIEPWGLALDEAHGRVYWSDNRNTSDNGSIRSANLDDGTDIASVVGIGLQFPTALALDVITPTAINETPSVPVRPHLSSPWPNPFQSTTTFTLILPRSMPVMVRIFDMLGREWLRLNKGTIPGSTEQHFTIDGTGLPDGVYLIMVGGEGMAFVRKLVRIR